MSNPATNPATAYTEVLQTFGLEVEQPIGDGKLHRVKCAHDNNGGNSGRYFFHNNGVPMGKYGCFHEHNENGLGLTWKSDAPDTRTEAEKSADRERIAQAQAERSAETLLEQANTATMCFKVWATSADATSDNPYLIKKGIQPHGTKTDGKNLLIPIYDGEHSLSSLQTIDPSGQKRFQYGGKITGCFHKFGNPASNVLLICEGFATGASIAEATGYQVVCAFNAGNLAPVAQKLKISEPKLNIIIAGDNDASNVGQDKARAAASSIGAHLAIVDFSGMDIGNVEKPPTDFNDLHKLAGLESVKAQIDAGLARDAMPIVETDDDLIKRLATMPILEYMQSCKAACQRFGITASQLKAVVGESRAAINVAQEPDRFILFPMVEPHDEEVDGAEVLNEVLAQLQTYVIADKETLHAAALWVAMTWLVDYATVLPLAIITAPERGCGKTTLLSTMAKMVCKPVTTSSISPAAMFRIIEAYQPTLLLDETDATFKDNEELRGIVNSGHTKDAAIVIRTVGDDHEPKPFSTWSAKLLCGIGRIPETIESRAIILKMRRKFKGEGVSNLRHAPNSVFTQIQRRLARWAIDNSTQFAELRPIMDGLSNRNADNYEPLLAIAMLAGDEWVNRIKSAALKLTEFDGDSLSISEKLLADIRNIFTQHTLDKISSLNLISKLCNDEEDIWATYNRGRSITANQISTRLAKYGIKSKNMRIDNHVCKGYEVSQFTDAFTRYLDDISQITPEMSNLSATSLQPINSVVYNVADTI